MVQLTGTDGAIIVGSAHIGQVNPYYRHAFHWTEASGMLDIPPAFSAPTAGLDASSISGNGTVVAGVVTAGFGGPPP